MTTEAVTDAWRVTRADDVFAVYERHRDVHPYGIADVQQLWDRSTWWRRGAAVVGCLDLPGSDLPVLYAVSADDDAATLTLLADLDAVLPPRFVIHGPRGLEQRLAGTRHARWANAYRKLALRDLERLPAADPGVRVLDRADVPDLEALYATDPAAGDFFHPALLDGGHYVGLTVDGRLVCSAGVHVVDRVRGVAAIGNVATHPEHRRRGLARRVVATLCHRLCRDVEVVGLNVAEANTGAAALYVDLGFTPVARYTEAELDRRPPADARPSRVQRSPS